jgi:arabinogalactan oligomer/maltooligosaccharide transport system permease protein
MTSGILLNIPTDLYEAARVDGTSKIKMFFKITMPYIFFITTPYLISSFIGNINSFNTIFLLSGGGPTVTDALGSAYRAGETDLLVTWLYKLTIDNGDYNTGAVIGILTFLFTSTITLITYRNSKAYKEEDTFQ